MTGRHRLAALLMHPHLAAVATGVMAVVAIAVGLAIPHAVPLNFVEEGGFVEQATLYAYFVSVVGICLLRWSTVPILDVVAACVVLLAMAAREASLHTAMYGISILKSRFYLDAPLHQILGALAVLLPILLALAWLFFRHVRHWLQPPSRWSVAARTMALMVGTVVFTKLVDRTPATFGIPPGTVYYVMLSIEEILEFLLPLFALLTMVQCRLADASALSPRATGRPSR